MSLLTADFFATVIRAMTPILFATMAAAVAAKSGITNMALEGMMLFAALFGVIFSSLTGSWLVALLITMAIGGVIGFVMAWFILQLKTDEILAAIALNTIATGGTVLLMLAYSGDRGTSTSVLSETAPVLNIPGIEQIPVIGELISGHNIMAYLSILAVVVIQLLLFKTPLGLKIRAVGENKNAAESVGISSNKIQYTALVISGVLAAMGGFYMSGGYTSSFASGMVSGRGFIALAASSMGANNPIGGFFVSLLFGGAQATATTMTSFSSVPPELMQMLPYVVTLIGLAVYSYLSMQKRKRLSGK